MLTWHLFIDESGRQEDPKDEAVVAGYLVRGGSAAARGLSLWRAVAELAPYLRWPLHRAWCELPLHHALSIEDHVYWAPPHGRPNLPPSLVKASAKVLAALPTAELEPMRDAYRNGGHAPLEILRRLDEQASDQAPADAYQCLCGYSRELSTGFARLMRSLASGAVDEPTVRLVLSGEGRRGHLASRHRYRVLLRRLLERAAAIVARQPGEHRIEPHILERDVHLDEGPRPLQVSDVDWAAIESPYGGRVRFANQVVVRFDAGSDAGVVVADFVAFVGRSALRTGKDLTAIELRLLGQLGLQARSGNPGRTHVTGTTPGSGVKPWARQATGEWEEVR